MRPPSSGAYSGGRPEPKRPDKPKIKHISQNTIRSKWVFLDEDAQQKVESMFRAVELPVLAKHQSDHKKIEAQATIGSVTKT